MLRFAVGRDGFLPQEQIEFLSGGLECVTTIVRPSGAGVIAGRHDGKLVVRMRTVRPRSLGNARSRSGC